MWKDGEVKLITIKSQRFVEANAEDLKELINLAQLQLLESGSYGTFSSLVTSKNAVLQQLRWSGWERKPTWVALEINGFRLGEDSRAQEYSCNFRSEFYLEISIKSSIPLVVFKMNNCFASKQIKHRARWHKET